MATIKYEHYKPGTVGGTAVVLKSYREKGKKYPQQKRILLLGSIVEKISNKEGIFLNYEDGLFGFSIEKGKYEVDPKSFPILEYNPLIKDHNCNFGASYVFTLIIKQNKYIDLINKCFTDELDKKLFLTLIYYRFCSGSDRDELATFLEKDVIGIIFSQLSLDYQHISLFLSRIGQKEFHSSFIENFNNIICDKAKEGLPIDFDFTNNNATSNYFFKQDTNHGSKLEDENKTFTKNKINLKILPFEKQTPETIEGYSLLNFMISHIYIDIYKKIDNLTTVDDLFSRLNLYTVVIRQGKFINKSYILPKAIEAAKLLDIEIDSKIVGEEIFTVL
jgi:hypothetical protein